MIKATDETIMPFGAHRGKKLANVPANYLIWMYENKRLVPYLEEYVKDNWLVLETEIKRQNYGK